MAAPPIAERHLPHFHRRAPMKEACRVATTANITISTALNNGDSLDGITLATGDRVLVKNQSAGAENGIYEVGVSPARAYDLSTDDPSFGFLVYVRQGTTNGVTLWENTNTSAPTIASTALTFSQVGGTSTLTVEEVDGSPTDSAITKIIFPNGTLSISSHEATYTPGAGSGASSSAEYVTTASDGSLSAEVNIPGFAGSVDIKSAGGSDDEFDASGLSGWTSFGSPDTSDSDTTRLSHVYLKKNAASGAHAAGIYKANPSMPFTMTAKLAACALRADFNMAGIFVGVANPAAGAFKASLLQHGGVAGNINTGVIAWTNPTTYNGGGTYANVPNGPALPVYLRIIATSSTNVTFGFSYDGRFYKDVVSANNPGFTIGSVGLLVNPDNASNAGEADFDWIRFT